MKRSPQELEESIREHVRRKVESSPALEEEYDRRWYEEPDHNAFRGVACVVQAVLAALVGLPFVVLVVAVAAVLTGFFAGGLSDTGPSPSYLALIAHAMFLSALLIHAGLESIPWVPDNRRLQVLCHFPVGDDEVFRTPWGFGLVWTQGSSTEARHRSALSTPWGLGVVWTFAISVPLVTLLPGYLASSHDLSPLGWAVALGLGLLHLPVCFAVATLMAVHFPRTTAPGSAAAVFGVSLLVTALFGPTLVGASLDPEALSTVKLFFFILPAGWVNGALYYGLLEGHPAGWLLLIPVAAVIKWWLVWKARAGRIREIIFYPAGGADPIFERGAHLPTAPFRLRPGPTPKRL